MSQKIDISLIQQCMNNNRIAQKELYAILLPYLNALSRRYLNQPSHAEDVLQEAFILIFRNIEQYDVAKASFKTWATKITINCCLKDNDKNERRRYDQSLEANYDIAVTPEIVHQLSSEELTMWLRQLPEDYYEVFNLHVIEGFSHDEIGKMLGIKASLSRKRLSRAKDILQKSKGRKTIWRTLTGS